MKKRTIFLSILCVMMVISNKHSVQAACNNVSQYGAISVKITALSSSGTYTIWTRMQVPDTTHNQYQLEINGQRCYVIGGSSISPDQWTWVSFQDGDLSSRVSYDFERTTNNAAKLIGSSAGVRIDRLLLVKTDCVPIADGNNCQSDSVPTSAIETTGATQVPSPSAGPISGLIIPSQTIARNPGIIAQVIYNVDGKLLPTTTNFALDTTLLSNGPHLVVMQITTTAGRILNEATNMTVENPVSALSPMRRWVRLNQRTTVVASSIIGGLLIASAAFQTVRHIRLKKRLLRFRGF